MDAFERAAVRRLRQMKRETCKHSIGAKTCRRCGALHCAVCQPKHTCEETS